MAKIGNRKASKIYSSIYAEELRKVAYMAFFDGIEFSEGVRSGVITKEMINEDFFAILNEANHNNREL